MSQTRAADMADIVKDLRSKHSQLSYAIMNNTAANTFTFTLAPVIAYVFDRMGISPGYENDALKTALSVTAQAIDVLAGYTQSESYGNLYDRAINDDKVFKVWADLANDTGNTIQLARGYAGYSVSDYLTDAYDRLAVAGKAAAGASTNYAIVAVIVLVAILIFK